MSEQPREPLDAEIGAVFARLRDEVRGAPPSGPADGRPGADEGRRARARAQAGRLWPVAADRAVARRPGPRGFVLHPAKLLLRRLMRWYVEPLAVDQRGFNEAVLRMLDDLEARVRALEGGRTSEQR